MTPGTGRGCARLVGLEIEVEARRSLELQGADHAIGLAPHDDVGRGEANNFVLAGEFGRVQAAAVGGFQASSVFWVSVDFGETLAPPLLEFVAHGLHPRSS